MKKTAAVVALIALVAGLFFVFRSGNSVPQNPATTPAPEQNSASLAAPKNSESVPPGAPAEAGSTPATVTTPPAPLPTAPAPEVSSLPPLTVLDQARIVVKNYGAEFGENPVGTNPEITAALTGKNAKQINFITAESGLRVNGNGEMVDAWDTPFFFHQISGHEMEIRSAGEDRKMWTPDDLITR